MKYLLCLVGVISFIIPGEKSPIIVRHDIEDNAYLRFAQELPITSNIVKYNSTDVAGTLITPQWILSAAHVAETIKENHKLIIANDSLSIEKIVIHPGWLENGRPEDIALIKLTDSVSNIISIEVYTERDEISKEVIIIGNGDFGTGLTGPKGNDGKFRAATNLVDEATNDYLIWGFEDPRFEPEKLTPLEGISGPGDSSGPAFIKVGEKYLLAGISSAQSTRATDGREGLYGVIEYYTRVSSYIQWIEDTISE